MTNCLLEIGPDGHPVGRDPRKVPAEVLADAGHARISPIRAIRRKCLDCNYSTVEVRLCTATGCPLWPFRLGVNPHRAEPSEARREASRAAAERMAAARKKALKQDASRAMTPPAGVHPPAARDDAGPASFAEGEG